MDLLLQLTTDGVDAVYENNDLKTTDGFENMILLGMFGGNPQQSTPTQRLESAEAFDWWGNPLLFNDEPDLQFNSSTQRTLQNVSLTTANRLVIQQAVEQDLAFMSAFADINVEVTYPAIDRVRLAVGVTQPGNLQQRQYIYIWDATRQILQSGLASTTITAARPGLQHILQTGL